MGLLVLPNGRPGTLQKETLSREEIDLVTRFENWCERRELKLDLVCEVCYREGRPGARCQGNNTRDSAAYKITCGHCERTYGVEMRKPDGSL